MFTFSGHSYHHPAYDPCYLQGHRPYGPPALTSSAAAGPYTGPYPGQYHHLHHPIPTYGSPFQSLSSGVGSSGTIAASNRFGPFNDLPSHSIHMPMHHPTYRPPQKTMRSTFPDPGDFHEKPRKRKWQEFPGRNRFYCDGRIMMAKQISVFYFTVTLLVVTVTLFCVFEYVFSLRVFGPVASSHYNSLFAHKSSSSCDSLLLSKFLTYSLFSPSAVHSWLVKSRLRFQLSLDSYLSLFSPHFFEPVSRIQVNRILRLLSNLCLFFIQCMHSINTSSTNTLSILPTSGFTM